MRGELRGDRSSAVSVWLHDLSPALCGASIIVGPTATTGCQARVRLSSTLGRARRDDVDFETSECLAEGERDSGHALLDFVSYDALDRRVHEQELQASVGWYDEDARDGAKRSFDIEHEKVAAIVACEARLERACLDASSRDQARDLCGVPSSSVTDRTVDVGLVRHLGGQVGVHIKLRREPAPLIHDSRVRWIPPRLQQDRVRFL